MKKKKIHFTPIQKSIIKYKLDEESGEKMAELEHCSIATTDRKIKKIAVNIKILFDINLI